MVWRYGQRVRQGEEVLGRGRRNGGDRRRQRYKSSLMVGMFFEQG